MKKNLFKLLLCMTFATLALSLSSCDRDDMDEMDLVGYWWSVDDPYDVISLELGSNNVGTCIEYDRYGRIVSSDLFDWTVRNRVIHIYFRTGYREHWIWDYDLYNGNTVEINGRIFSRDRYYYSKGYQKDKLTEEAIK